MKALISNLRLPACSLLMGLVMFGLSPAIAQTSDHQDSPWQVVEESARDLMAALDQLRVMQEGDEVSDEMVQRLLDVLTPTIDFDTIARTVMGSHADSASNEQIDTFARVFRNTMARLYLESFLDFGIAEVSVEETPDDFNPASGRANVTMQATDEEGTYYQVRYSMRTDEQGRWRVRNIIVESINLGLTYLNQFDSAVRRQGSVDQVINNWRNEVESVDVSAD
ncbi:MAG: ABC transporter substrate-binding protein [Pseudohongiellaceae bacterium]